MEIQPIFRPTHHTNANESNATEVAGIPRSPPAADSTHVIKNDSHHSPADQYLEKNKLSIVTYNVKNLKSNFVCVNSLLNNHDVVIIQEHWLFKFEEILFKKFNSDWDFHAKFVDQADPIPPTQKPRGFGGTAIIWNSNSDLKITKLPDGDHRVVCVEIDASPKPILLMCVYMPSKGSKCRDNEYNESLDQISHIILKYSESHDIICSGDWNATLLTSSTLCACL
mgnify:CR=1 FL=1